MKALMLQILQDYAILGIIILALIGIFILARMHRQLKKLNRNLGMITKNIQQYFEVIMVEEEEETAEEAVRTSRREEMYLTGEERERRLSRTKTEQGEEDAVFNSVMQEYFP